MDRNRAPRTLALRARGPPAPAEKLVAVGFIAPGSRRVQGL